MAVYIPLEKKPIQLFLGLFSVIFSGLLEIAISIPLSNDTVGIAIQSMKYICVWGAIIIYLALVLAIASVFLYVMMKAMMFSFQKMAPNQPQKTIESPK